MTLIDSARLEEWNYEVTGVSKNEDAFVPNLTAAPREWFTETPPWWGDLEQYSIWADDNGRVAGLIANYDQCYLNWTDDCFTAPPVDDKEKFVYQGNVTTAEGDKIAVSILAATKGHHFSDSIIENVLANQGFLDDNFKPLETSHDIMAHQLAYGRYVNTPQGIAFLGALFPHVSASMVNRLRASAVSGHWQYDQTDDRYHFAGAVFVNAGALPLRDKSKLQLRQMAASLRYNHIMADEQACSCKEKSVLAATDPNLQTASGQIDGLQSEPAISDVVAVVDEHSMRLDTLEKVVMELIRERDTELLDQQNNGTTQPGGTGG